MSGFKSFVKKTEIQFENAMNVVVGPNGSGKSNITDALCFVLGRKSIKSIRAAKAANLLFSGNSAHKGATEAYVELIFDNADNMFAVDSIEVSIKRILNKNGLSIYKINNEKKTRQEVIELLAHAGVDPNGANIILQGNVMDLVKMGSEERRRVVEDVAGISVYENRKTQSISELAKAEERLKEVSTVLREKNAYLRNLEKDRQDAINYQKIEENVKKCKATIISKTMKDREKQIWSIEKILENHKKEIQEKRKQVSEKEVEVNTLHESISDINKQLQSSAGKENETLHKEISELKSILGATSARRENFENRISQNNERKSNLRKKIKEIEEEIQKIQISSPEVKKQQETLKSLKEKFESLEKQRRSFYIIKSDLFTFQSKKEEREKSIAGYNKEIEIITQNINNIFEEIKYSKALTNLVSLKEKTANEINSLREKRLNSERNTLELEKANAVNLQIINRENKLKEDILKLDVCPMCKNKITEEHRSHVIKNAESKIKKSEEEYQNNKTKIKTNMLETENILKKISENEQKQNEIEMDIFKIRSVDEKKESMKRIILQKQESEQTLKEINEKINETRNKFRELENIEEKYEETRIKINDLSLYNKIDTDTNVVLKQKELERAETEVKSIGIDTEETERELHLILEKEIETKKVLEKKESEEQRLYEKYQRMYTLRSEVQDKQKAIETMIMGVQHDIRNIEEKIGSINIQKAQLGAQLESLKAEFEEFKEIDQINLTIEQARARLQESQFRLNQLGSINLKAVEVYDQVKFACDQITEKINTINHEREKIIKIISEIDKKKKKAFIKTLESLNELFIRNCSQLTKKGEVYLELENKEDPFAGGLDILVRVGRGKLFDITSMSGGEKTLIALSLIFAIQEYKPYCFYVFDEIDAALDKHNSELLAALIKRYMLSGQYIVITHNDALITEATTLYGVSMQEGISQIVSIKL